MPSSNLSPSSSRKELQMHADQHKRQESERKECQHIGQSRKLVQRTPQSSESTDSMKEGAYFSNARKAAGSTSGSSISVDVVAMPPLNMASKTALPTARTNLTFGNKTTVSIPPFTLSHFKAFFPYAFTACSHSQYKDWQSLYFTGQYSGRCCYYHSASVVLALALGQDKLQQ